MLITAFSNSLQLLQPNSRLAHLILGYSFSRASTVMRPPYKKAGVLDDSRAGWILTRRSRSVFEHPNVRSSLAFRFGEVPLVQSFSFYS
jgi:hypothetical protein